MDPFPNVFHERLVLLRALRDVIRFTAIGYREKKGRARRDYPESRCKDILIVRVAIHCRCPGAAPPTVFWEHVLVKPPNENPLR